MKNILEKLKKKNNKIVFIVLVIIVLFGTWLRISGTLSDSFSFTYDVGRDMLTLQEFISTKKPMLIGQTTGLSGFFYGPWWYYLLSIPFLISQGNPQVVALFIAFTGILTIVLSFVLGKKISGTFLGLVFAFFVSLSPVMIGFSAQIWNPNVIPLFLVLLLLAINRIQSIKDKKKLLWKEFLIFGLLLGFIQDMEIIFGILLSIGTLISIILFLRKHINFRSYFFMVIGIVIIHSPKFLFELRHDFLMTKSLLSIFDKSSGMNSSIVSRLDLSRINYYKNLWVDTTSGQNNLIGLILLLFVIIAFIMFYRKTKEKETFFINFAFVNIFTFIILSFFLHELWTHYLVGIPLLYILLLALSLNLFKNNFKNAYIPFIIIFIFFWVNLNPIKFLNEFNKPLWEGNSAVYRNQLATIDYIYREAGGRKFKYALYTPPVRDNTYRYLFNWYGNKKYGYIPEENKANLYFVILEPDYEAPDRLKTWLKVRETDGKIIKEQRTKGDIVVQTRIN